MSTPKQGGSPAMPRSPALPQAPFHPACHAPCQGPDERERMAQSALPLGKGGSPKTLEKLRQAIASAQPDEGPEVLRLAGAQARWLALGAVGPMPEAWQLVVHLRAPESTAKPQDDKDLQTAARRFCKRLVKKGFVTASVRGTTVVMPTSDHPEGATLHVCPAGGAPLEASLACHQLTYDFTGKSWHVLPGLTWDAAWEYARQGHWRAPGIAPSAPAAISLPRPMQHLQEAASALMQSWQHQQAGHRPQGYIDPQDVSSMLTLLNETEAMVSRGQNAQVVTLVHHMFAPWLTQAGTTARHEQLGLAAVALCQLALACHAGAADGQEQPVLLRTLRAFMRSNVDPNTAYVSDSVELALALSAPLEQTELLRQHLMALWPQDPAVRVAVVGKGDSALLRLQLLALHTHLYVPIARHQGVNVDSSTAPTLAGLTAALGSVKSLGHKIAQLLDCTALQVLMTPARIHHNGQAKLWAKLLPEPQNRTPRLVLAAALLSPDSIDELTPSVRAAALPQEAWARCLELLGHERTQHVGGKDVEICAQRLTLLRGDMIKNGFDSSFSAARMGALVSALTVLQLHDVAFALLASKPDAVDHLGNAELLTLYRAALGKQPLVAQLILSQCALNASTRAFFLAEGNGLIAACKHQELLVAMAYILASGPVMGPPSIWQAWFNTASVRRDASALLAFAAKAQVVHEKFETVATALAEKACRRPQAALLQGAYNAWQAILMQKKGDDAAIVAAAAWLLRLHVEAHEHHIGALMSAEVLSELARVVMRPDATQDRLTLVNQATHTVPDGRLRIQFLGHLLRHLDAPAIKAVLQDKWRMAVSEAALYASIPGDPMTEDRAVKFHQLALLQWADGDDAQSTQRALPLVACCGQLLAKHHYSALSHSLFDHALNQGANAVALFDHMQALSLLPGEERQWVEVAALAQRHMAQAAALEARDETPMALNKVVFWSTVIASAVELRCAQPEGPACDEETLFHALQEVIRLLILRHTFVQLSAEDELIDMLVQASDEPALNDRLMGYAVRLMQECKLESQAMGEAYDAGPMSEIMAALLRGAALGGATDCSERARTLLQAHFGAQFCSQTRELEPNMTADVFNHVMNFADLLLSVQQTAQERGAILRSLVICNMEHLAYYEHMERLTAIMAAQEADEAERPILAACDHLLQRMGQTPQDAHERKLWDLHALNVAYASAAVDLHGEASKKFERLSEIFRSLECVEDDTVHRWHKLALRIFTNYDEGTGLVKKDVKDFLERIEGQRSRTSLVGYDRALDEVALTNQINALMIALNSHDHSTKLKALAGFLHYAPLFDYIGEHYVFITCKKELALLNRHKVHHLFYLASLIQFSFNLPEGGFPASFMVWLNDLMAESSKPSVIRYAILRALIDTVTLRPQNATVLPTLSLAIVKQHPQEVRVAAEPLLRDIAQLQQEVKDHRIQANQASAQVAKLLQQYV